MKFLINLILKTNLFFFNFVNYIVKPYANIIYIYVLQNFSQSLLNNLFLWKVSNYADAYWFIYSNKRTLHDIRYL